MIPITNYQSVYELTEDSTLKFTTPRRVHQYQFNDLVNAGMARGSGTSHVDINGEPIDNTEIDLPAGTGIKIIKLKISKAVEESDRYHWNDYIRFSILHPSLKGIQFKTVGRYDVKIHGRENMKQLSKLKTEEIMD